MRTGLRISIIAAISLFIMNVVSAQATSLSKEYKTQAIERLSQLMNDFYVFPDVAKKTERHLLQQLKDGHYDDVKDDEVFATMLTESVQSINKDKHMRIWKNRPYEEKENTPERMIEERLDRLERSRFHNAGFNTIEVMDGNVGYLDLRGFAGMHIGKDIADAYMKLIANTDAVIVDLSKNGGGSPEMVQYLCSYFFKEKVHLNSLYFRQNDETIDFWTVDVDGSKMPDVPLFVITSSKTFSGAEEFSYNMQTQKRATLIGQTTGGGANPGGSMGINDNLSVFIPGGMAINPITKTNWEGVGVIPEIKTSPEETLEKTHSLAKEAAEKYRSKTKKKYTDLFMDLSKTLIEYNKGESEEAIHYRLDVCRKEGLLGEGDINALGYEYMMQYKKTMIAQAIFLSNTKFFPKSANVYDSYAESLMMNGDLNESLKNYNMAYEISLNNEDGDSEFYKSNMEKVKKMIKEKGL